MGGGSSAPTETTVTQNTSNLPAYAEPYVTDLMSRSQGLLNTPYQTYPGLGAVSQQTTNADGTTSTSWSAPNQSNVQIGNAATGGGNASDVAAAGSGSRIAGFTPAQAAVQQATMGLQTPGQFGNATSMAQNAVSGYTPMQFSAAQVQGGNQSAPTMTAAQTGYNPNLQNYQMSGPQQFSSDSAQQYMSPYMQNVVDVQKQQAIRDAQIGQVGQNEAAASQGTYGGSRQLLAQMENQRALQTQLGGIQASGLQNAYQQAQQQFNTQQALGQQAGQANLQANLATQQLGTQTGLQSALANMNAQQQAAVQNQAAQLQSQGLNQQQALQAALANQSTNMQAQQLGSQAQQFGANLGLQGAQTLGNLGTAQQNADISRLTAQGAVGNQQQAMNQQILSQNYQDFLTQQQYPAQQLGTFSNLIHGTYSPQTTQATYGQAPSMGSQVAGLGLGALSLSKLIGGS